MATVRPTPRVAMRARRRAAAPLRPPTARACRRRTHGRAGPASGPHCPLCFGALEPLPGAGGYARHRSARCSAQCVLTTRQYQPEELTIRGSRDVQVAAGHRERFVAHWVRHYTLMRRAWPALTIARFIAVIACADVADLWSYRMLRDDDLAAVLLVLAGFLRVPDALGTEAPGTDTRAPTVRWVRFWFDASVRDVGDLWTAGGSAPPLFRVDYREPLVTPYPTGAQVQAWQPVDGMRDAWAQRIDAQEPAVEASDCAAFVRFLARASALGTNL